MKVEDILICKKDFIHLNGKLYFTKYKSYKIKNIYGAFSFTL